MRVLKTLSPGTPGTKRFVAKYGKALVCVRYRHDPRSGNRFTSVELVVERTRVYSPRRTKNRRPDDAPLWLKLERNEWLLRRALKAAGAIWRGREMVWVVTPEIVKALRLWDRVFRGSRPDIRNEPMPPAVDDHLWRDTPAQ